MKKGTHPANGDHNARFLTVLTSMLNVYRNVV